MAAEPQPDSAGSPNPMQGYDRTRAALTSAKSKVFAHLDAHPELARRPKEVALALHVNVGSAKRLLHEWREAHAPRLESLLSPALVQNVRIVGRTTPDTVSQGSPPSASLLVALGQWEDRGDNKLTAVLPIPHLEGSVEVVLSGRVLELRLAAARGLTWSEIHVVLALLRLPFDPDAEASLTFEVFRDGASARFEGVEARTYRDAQGLLLKAYNHEDGRGTLARVEVCPPPVRATYRELEAFLEGKQPVGRDARIEALELQVRENSEAFLMLRREVKLALRRLDSGGSGRGSL